MKYAADFRQEARAALQGKWPLAILVGLVAAILGGATSGGPEFKINFTGGSLNANIQYAGQTIYSWGDGITPGLRAVLVGGAIYLILAAIVLGVLYFILGSVIEVGYARFNLNLTAGEKPPFETLFSYFPYWKTIAVTALLQAVYILLTEGNSHCDSRDPGHSHFPDGLRESTPRRGLHHLRPAEASKGAHR